MLQFLWFVATFQNNHNQAYLPIFAKNVYDKDVFAISVKYDNFWISLLISFICIVVHYAFFYKVLYILIIVLLQADNCSYF